MDKSNKRQTRSSGKPKEREAWSIKVTIKTEEFWGGYPRKVIRPSKTETFSVSIKPTATEEELQELIYKRSKIKIHPSVANIQFGRQRGYPGCAYNPYEMTTLKKMGFYDGCTIEVREVPNRRMVPVPERVASNDRVVARVEVMVNARD